MNSKAQKLFEQAWSLNYLYPDKFWGAKIPDPHPVPSNTCTLTMDRIIKPYEGSSLIYFSPIVETTAPYFNNYVVNSGLPTGNLAQYIVYADNHNAPMSIDANNVLSSLETWAYKQGPSASRLSAYKKLRVVGAYMEIKVMDKEEAYSGIIETCMGIEIIGNGLKNDLIDLDRMSNHPNYAVFTSKESIILKYRYSNEKYTLYGPYEPYSMVPFHMVKITGLSASASVRIKTHIHIEGMLMPALVHFATKSLIVQEPKWLQQNFHQEVISTLETKTTDDNNAEFFASEHVPDEVKDYVKEETTKADIEAGNTEPEIIIPNEKTKSTPTENLKKRPDLSEDIFPNEIPDKNKPKSWVRKMANGVFSDVKFTVHDVLDVAKRVFVPHSKDTVQYSLNNVSGNNQLSTQKTTNPMQSINQAPGNNKRMKIQNVESSEKTLAIMPAPEVLLEEANKPLVDEYVAEKPNMLATLSGSSVYTHPKFRTPGEVLEESMMPKGQYAYVVNQNAPLEISHDGYVYDKYGREIHVYANNNLFGIGNNLGAGVAGY